MIKTIKKHLEYTKTVNELNRLSDRELNDLGINRGSIKEIARGNVL